MATIVIVAFEIFQNLILCITLCSGKTCFLNVDITTSSIVVRFATPAALNNIFFQHCTTKNHSHQTLNQAGPLLIPALPKKPVYLGCCQGRVLMWIRFLVIMSGCFKKNIFFSTPIPPQGGLSFFQGSLRTLRVLVRPEDNF